MDSKFPQYQNTVTSLWRLQKIILETLDFNQVVQKIVDSVAIELDYLNRGFKVVVLALVDKEQQILKRISMSQTPSAESVMGEGKMAFDEIVIPLTATENFCIKTYLDKQIRVTSDWKDILTPPMSDEESRRLQRVAGIKNSMILPVVEKDQCIGIIIFSMAKEASEISDEEKDLLQSFTEIVSLAIHDAELYSELDRAHVKLKELDKLKDEFISIASHELRNPAAVVKDYLWSVLDEGKNLAPDVRSDIEKAVAANQRLVQLINDLLDVSRIEGGRLEINNEVFNLGQLIGEVVAESSKKASDKQIELKYEFGDAKVLADKEKIRQVLMNLIDNAVKFSAVGKLVEIKIEDNKVKIVDQGVGIDPEQERKLFSKFGRLDTLHTVIGKVSGNGLGLYICKKIVELNGGQMGYESSYGQGATFWFTLNAHE